MESTDRATLDPPTANVLRHEARFREQMADRLTTTPEETKRWRGRAETLRKRADELEARGAD